MKLVRKGLFLIALVEALFGTGTQTSVQAAASGGTGHPLPMHFATLPSRERVRRPGRRARSRAIERWNRRRLRETARRIRPRSDRVLQRLALHDSYARGPPRSLIG